MEGINGLNGTYTMWSDTEVLMLNKSEIVSIFIKNGTTIIVTTAGDKFIYSAKSGIKLIDDLAGSGNSFKLPEDLKAVLLAQ